MSTTHCPSRDAIRDYLVGKLPDAPSDALAGHLESCPGCQAELATLSDADDTLVARLRGPVAPDAYLEEPVCGEALARAKAVVGAGQAPGDAEEDASAILVLEQLGDYQLLGELGRGSMGRVYKALHRKLERLVALKILPRGRTDDPQAVARFQREMKAIGRLDHPNIVRAYDAREVQGRPVLVMEYLEGLDVGAVVRRLGPVGVAEACEVARQAACGLECAREHGLVHRDVKPSNLMLTPQGQVKLLDLGLARFHRGPASGEEVTGTGQAMGTADYIAPEQAADSREVDIRADVYSLGCTLYKMLSGRAPFGGPQYAGALEKMMAHVREPVPPLGQLNPDVPEGLVAVVERMLAKDPEARYGTPAEVAEALAPWCAGSDLPGLLARAAAVVEEPTLAPGAASQRPPRAVAAQPAEPLPQPAPRPWKRAAVLVGLILLSLGIGVFLGIVIRIENDGRKITIETTPEEGGAKGPDSGVNLQAISPAKPGAPAGEASKSPAAPATIAADVAADEQAILGTWQVVSKGPKADSLPARARTRAEAKPVVGLPALSPLRELADLRRLPITRHCLFGFRYRLDPTKKPKTVDLIQAGKTVALGIYDLSGDQLSLCFSTTPQRPSDFNPPPGSGSQRYVLSRYKAGPAAPLGLEFDKWGVVRLGGREVQPEALAKLLRGLTGADPDWKVGLLCDPEVPFPLVAALSNLVRTARVKEVLLRSYPLRARLDFRMAVVRGKEGKPALAEADVQRLVEDLKAHGPRPPADARAQAYRTRLEQTLAEIIGSMRGVGVAIVRIGTLADKDPLKLPRQTVTVLVAPFGSEPLRAEQVEPIRHLAAAALAGIDPGQVNVIDISAGDTWMDQASDRAPESPPPAEDAYGWFELRDAAAPPLVTAIHEGRSYVLLSNRPEEVMLTPTSRLPPGPPDTLRMPFNAQKRPVIEIGLSQDATSRMATLSRSHPGGFVAILVDDLVVSIPEVRRLATSHVEIDGNFSVQEADRVIQALGRARGMPGEFSPPWFRALEPRNAFQPGLLLNRRLPELNQFIAPVPGTP